MNGYLSCPSTFRCVWYTVRTMIEEAILSPEIALAVIAFLLSLLPAGFFIWLWYLRKHSRLTPPSAVAIAFALGLALVLPAFQLEDWSERVWRFVSPSTVHYFAGALLPLQEFSDILFPAIGTFLVVATIEEGTRYLVIRLWLRRSSAVDQVFDGLLVGVAMGLGFATLENTVYFLQLFRSGDYDTLVFVFFLRFIISTLAHVSFAGIMGALVARGIFDMYNGKRYLFQAFLVPWWLHGMYDLLLGISHGLYAVLILLPPLLVLIYWTQRPEFFILHRKAGKFLAVAQAPRAATTEDVQAILRTLESPWNVNAPWLNHNRSHARILRALYKNET